MVWAMDKMLVDKNRFWVDDGCGWFYGTLQHFLGTDENPQYTEPTAVFCEQSFYTNSGTMCLTVYFLDDEVNRKGCPQKLLLKEEQIVKEDDYNITIRDEGSLYRNKYVGVEDGPNWCETEDDHYTYWVLCISE